MRGLAGLVRFGLVLVLALTLSSPALAWNGSTHTDVTNGVYWQCIQGTTLAQHYLGCTGRWIEIENMPGQGAIAGDSIARLIHTTPRVDNWEDLEFVDVDGAVGDTKDDPHKDDGIWVIDDEAHTSEEGSSLTKFNHFIDIRHGSARYDDFDGYSYQLGSGREEEHQTAKDGASGWLQNLLAGLTGFMLDEGVMWWFNDEYVHAPGGPWYIGCSPALERYSFYGDKHLYSSCAAECKARFPLAQSTGQVNMGIPYSVFMPIDNLARYWYGAFLTSRDTACLAAVLHALHDATVPQHSAGCLGNWHQRWEDDFETFVNKRPAGLVFNAGFWQDVKATANAWRRIDPSPPTGLMPRNWDLLPALNWRVDELVTWLALRSYHEYQTTYNYFRNGYQFNPASSRVLAVMGAAMTELVLEKAAMDTGWTPPSSVVHVVAPPAIDHLLVVKLQQAAAGQFLPKGAILRRSASTTKQKSVTATPPTGTPPKRERLTPRVPPPPPEPTEP